ncbi:META domain-containing protein [Streptomyces pharetrae CZA14]|uniref:META domain-containing protein n=1 Tax=Streptomyces pharetrae CZA14 TaxID=1144883 RepID=A0ABX3YI32_9ACTN|nr:META domain-containing protein [Streptomyces pharetrae CZA14]
MYRQTHRITRTAAVLALLPLAAACGTEKAGTQPAGADVGGVTGVHWAVDGVTVDGTAHDAPAGAYVTIDDSGRTQGNYGCNHFSARASFDGDRIRLGDASVTEMGCEEKPMKFEETLARTLADGPLRTRVSGDRLTLTTDGGDSVRLSKAQDASLLGTRWNVTALGANGVAQSLPQGAQAHLTFEEDGSVTGRLGCNKVNSTATVRDGNITLGTPSTTRMMCDASLMGIEKRLLRMFDGTVQYRLDHRTLTLTSENGESVTAVAAE